MSLPYIDRTMNEKGRIMWHATNIYKRGEIDAVIETLAEEYHLDNTDTDLIAAIKWITHSEEE